MIALEPIDTARRGNQKSGSVDLTPAPGRAREVNATQKPSVTETPHNTVGNYSADHRYDDSNHNLR
jgi:hypothetical protein